MLRSMTQPGRRSSTLLPTILLGLLLFPSEAPANRSEPDKGYRAAAKRAAPAVVSVLSSRMVRLSPEDLSFWDLFDWDLDLPRQYRQRGLGSGVVVSADGYVLTNEHVIAGATDIRVVYPDRREFKARRIGADAGTDIAVLKIEATGLPFLDLAGSTTIEVGDVVLAIGNPFGVGETVTMGIVSALARRGVVDPEHYEDFIQTDAAINPGNSGGALVTVRGELIGINTAIVSRSGGNLGIGFAVPASVARHTMTQILKHGRVIRGWLGVSIQPVDAVVARAFGLKEPAGVLVNDVTPESPAARAGIARGEIILEFNAQRVSDTADLRMKVTLKLFRDGKERTVRVTLSELPEEAPEPPLIETEPAAVDGVRLEQLTPPIARELGLPADSTGVVVFDVLPDSPAADAGLRAGDVIIEVDRRPATSVQLVDRALRNRRLRPLVLLVNRFGNTVYVVIDSR